MAPVGKRSTSGKRTPGVQRSRGSNSTPSRSMSLSSAGKVSATKARQPKLKTPPKAYIRAHEDSDSGSDGSDRTPSISDHEREIFKKHDSSSDEEDSDDHAATNKAKKKKRVYEYSLPSNPKRTQAVTRTDDRDDPIATQQPVVRENPLALWKTIDDSMKQVKVEKTAVHDFVANYLFPKLKFVRGTTIVNMEYSTDARSLCALVMAGCHQEHSAEGMI